jgi:stage II sporulation protein AA (anti-sigma F factor antagonist)
MKHMDDLLDEVPQPGGLVVRAQREADGLVLSLYGELDLSTSSLLERKLGMAEAGESERLVIDLSGLQFLDSTGLHTLVRAQKRWCNREGRSLSLLRGPRAVQRVFELTDAGRFFTFED